jgi:L-amino acid N-acyltransferase YncA
MPDTHVRPACLADAASIASLYSHYVHNSIVTFELDPPSASEIGERIAQSRARGLDWLVCKAGDGELVGYAYARPYKAERPAYDCTVEISVYLRHVGSQDETPRWIGKGLGRKLVTALLESICSVQSDLPSRDESHTLNPQRYHQVLAVQARPSTPTGQDDGAMNSFYSALGFQRARTLSKVGYKLGTWADVDFWQMGLGERDE